jgi:ferredoxin-NADP reductase
MEIITELISKETIAEGTMSFHFKKPEGFAYKAGQNIDMTLIDPPETDAEGNTRTFSLASSPSESMLSIATRMRDTAFKRILKNSVTGLRVKISNPMGSFILHQKTERPAIMLVGGIGITPFISMLKDATEKNLPQKIYLFYSNRRPEDAAYLKDLTKLSKINSNFIFIPTMTNLEKSQANWIGEKGYINKDMINKYANDLNDAVYYTAGPPAMVSAMRQLLNDVEISDDDIRTEEFAGY